jgi:hypothetical protein
MRCIYVDVGVSWVNFGVWMWKLLVAARRRGCSFVGCFVDTALIMLLIYVDKRCK